MAHQEKRAWIMLVVTVVAYTAYAVVVLTRAHGTPITEVAYAAVLIASIVLAIAANIVLDIVTSIGTPRSEYKADARDKEIARIGDLTGQSLLVVGAVAAMVLAMLDTNQFWIANVLYLGFVLSALLGSLAKIAGYRDGFQTW